jgi:hypothetical protein
MSYDALMRWEWEGGNPAFVEEWDAAPPAGLTRDNTLTQPRPWSERRRTPRGASASPLSKGDRHGDDSER